MSAIFRLGVATLRADTDPASALKGAITRAKVEHRKPERQLAHAERAKSRASCNQAEYLPDRSQMMQAWADLVDEMKQPESKVTPIKMKTAA